MKIYICLLKNKARNRIIEPIILGVGDTFLGAIDLCINAVPFFASKRDINSIEGINNSSYYYSDKQKNKLIQKFEKVKSEIDQNIENLMAQNIDTVEKLNIALQPFFKQIGVAERYCEIIEAEVGAIMSNVAQRLG